MSEFKAQEQLKFLDLQYSKYPERRWRRCHRDGL